MGKIKLQTNIGHDNIDNGLDYAIRRTNDIDTGVLLRLAIAAIIDELDYDGVLDEDQIVYRELRNPNGPYTRTELIQLMTRIALKENPLEDPEVMYYNNAKCIQLYKDEDPDYIDSIIVHDNTDGKISFARLTDLYYDIRKDVVILKFEALSKHNYMIDDLSIIQFNENEELTNILKSNPEYKKFAINILTDELRSSVPLGAMYNASLNTPYDKLSFYVYVDIEPSPLRDVYCKMFDNAVLVISLYGYDGLKSKYFTTSIASTTRTTVCIELKYDHET